jgi:hypothetical protein
MADNFSKAVPEALAGANTFDLGLGYPALRARSGEDVSSASHWRGPALDGVPPPEVMLFEAHERFPIRIRFAIYALASTSAWALLVLVIAAVF